MKDTWDKTITVDKKPIPKKRIREYYRRLWKKDPAFRNSLKKNGLFVRAIYNGKPTIVRKGVKVKDWDDVEGLIKDHAVEFHLPAKKFNCRSYVDIDMPPRYAKQRSKIAHSIVDKLKRRNINVKTVVNSPSGLHILSNTDKGKMKAALKDIATEDRRLAVAKSSRTKITLDVNEPNGAVPGSLSYKGKPYRKW